MTCCGPQLVRKRVRIEVTLTEDALKKMNLCWLDDLSNFKFSRMQRRYFRFMLPTFASVDHLPAGRSRAMHNWIERRRLEKFLSAGMVGLQSMDDAAHRGKVERRTNMRVRFKMDGRRLKPAARIGIGIVGTSVAYEEMSRSGDGTAKAQ